MKTGQKSGIFKSQKGWFQCTNEILKALSKGFQKKDRMTFGWKKFLKKLLEEVQEKGKPTKLVNGDTKASVSEEREVEIC